MILRAASHTSVVFLYIAAVVGILAVATHGSGTMISVDRFVAADNITMIVALSMVAIVTGRMVWDRCRWRFWRGDMINMSLAGMCVEACGWIAHRSYWAVWRILRAMEQWEIADSLEDVPAMTTAFGFILIVAGAVMIVSPWARDRFGPHWAPIVTLGLVCVWAISYQIPDLLIRAGGLYG